jgi:uncharacterized Zn finger protein
MRETLAQQAGLAWALVGALVGIVLLLILLLSLRARRKRSVEPSEVASPQTQPGGVWAPPQLDSAALAAALREAEAGGETERLPGLYLSLAQCRLEEKQKADAEDLLRKSIRGAAGTQQKDIHARARLALGDIAHAGGDLTTACEHWQIARALFHELKQGRDHEAVETRMLRNGCPTDWVLTDF